jgi:NAD(P)-dependent dehydrogenase (short-subunit alcohol dehydrogenase family)
VGRDPSASGWSLKKPRRPVAADGVSGHVADLALMSNVRVLADEIRGRYEHVDVLANNAGALFASREETSEGFEQTFALNHLAPFLLTNLLRGRLAGGRVVTTASNAHKSGRLDLDDLQSEKSYSPGIYGISKLCNVLFTRELARRAPELHANCFHPGVVRTGFAKNENGIWKVVATLGAPFFRSPERGARSLVWLALSDDAAALTGEYIEDEKVVAPSRPGPGQQPRTEPLGTERPARRPARRRVRLTPLIRGPSHLKRDEALSWPDDERVSDARGRKAESEPSRVARSAR